MLAVYIPELCVVCGPGAGLCKTDVVGNDASERDAPEHQFTHEQAWQANQMLELIWIQVFSSDVCSGGPKTQRWVHNHQTRQLVG